MYSHAELAWGRARSIWPGTAICVIVALAATFLSEHYRGPQLLYALLLGLALNFLMANPTLEPGIAFVSKSLLRLGVALLGARITLTQVMGLGLSTAAVVMVAVAVTLACGIVLARLFGAPRDLGLLTGASVAICGASAAMAVAAVLPQTKENERFTLMTVISVTLMSTLAMVLYPLIANAANLTATPAGVFLGGTIHDVAQVVAAGTLVGPESRDVATIVKLFRVALLAPVVLVVALLVRRRMPAGEARLPGVPLFLIGFMLLVVVGSTGMVEPAITEAATVGSRWLLVAAIAAAGIRTRLSDLADLGWWPVTMLLIESVFIAGVVLVMLWVLAAP